MRLPAALSLAAIALAAATGAQANLLDNAGAEIGDLTGWTVGGDSNPAVDNGSFDPGIDPHSGSFDFYGHTGDYGSLTQTVSLTGVAGSLLQVSFWEQGLNQGSPSDNASVTLTFYGIAGSALGSVTTDTVDSHDGSWANFTGTYAIPTGAVSVDYTMNFQRHAGSDNDSFIDDNSLTVVAVPEPATGGLMVGGLALLGALARRRLG